MDLPRAPVARTRPEECESRSSGPTSRGAMPADAVSANAHGGCSRAAAVGAANRTRAMTVKAKDTTM